MHHLGGVSVSTMITWKPWLEFVSNFVQLNFAKAEVHQSIIITQVLNGQSFSPLNNIVFHACFHLIMHLCHNSKEVIKYRG